jgi:hypothetical protein
VPSCRRRGRHGPTPRRHARCDAATAVADAASRWHIIACDFGAETFRNGMDPLAILSYLAGWAR